MGIFIIFMVGVFSGSEGCPLSGGSKQPCHAGGWGDAGISGLDQDVVGGKKATNRVFLGLRPLHLWPTQHRFS